MLFVAKGIKWFLILVLLSPILTYSSDIDKINIHLCSSKDREITNARKAWYPATVAAFYRLSAIYSPHNVHFNVLQDESCPYTPSFGCEGKHGKIYCSLNSLTRIQLSQAILASGYARKIIESKALLVPGPIAPDKALELADYTLDDDNLFVTKELMEIVKLGNLNFEDADLIPTNVAKLSQTITTSVLKDSGKIGHIKHIDKPEIVISYVIFESSVNYLFSYIIGHEISHSLGKCVFKNTSYVEENAGLMNLISEQDTGDKICRNPIDAQELAAEICSLRALATFDKYMHSIKSEIYQDKKTLRNMESIGRRSAIDTIAFLLSLGLHTTSDDILAKIKPRRFNSKAKVSVYEVKFPREYIYSPIRTIFFAEELKSREKNRGIVGICGSTASFLANTLPSTIIHCINIPDTYGTVRVNQKPLATLFGQYVPFRLKQYWNGKDILEPSTFQCM